MFETHLLLLMRLREGVTGQGLISLAGLPYKVTPRYFNVTSLPIKRPFGILVGKLVHLYIAQSSRYSNVTS